MTEGRKPKEGVYAVDKAYVLKAFPDTSNASVKAKSLRHQIAVTMANADLEMPQAEFDAKSIPELYAWLKQHGISKSSIKAHARKLTDIQKADSRSGKSRREIAKAKAKYVKLAKLDADALKTISLDDLKQKAAAAIGFDPDSPEAESLIRKRKRDWDKFEKDVAAGIRALF